MTDQPFEPKTFFAVYLGEASGKGISHVYYPVEFPDGSDLGDSPSLSDPTTLWFNKPLTKSAPGRVVQMTNSEKGKYRAEDYGMLANRDLAAAILGRTLGIRERRLAERRAATIAKENAFDPLLKRILYIAGKLKPAERRAFALWLALKIMEGE